MPWEEENMPAVWEQAVGWMSVRVVIPVPSQKTDPQAHNRKAHTCHTHSKKACTRSLWTLSEAWLAAVCSQITARCSQSAMGSGRGMGGRDFRSKHQAYVGQLYTFTTWPQKKETRCKTKGRASSYWSACPHQSSSEQNPIYSLKPAVHTHLSGLTCV